MLNNLAILYSDTYRLKEAELLLRESLDVYQELAKRNPAIYESKIVTLETTLAAFSQARVGATRAKGSATK